ncbi:MAG TPA: fumarylacetoacetate hydrolase family protein [Beijerinckiaceae bacterium]|jgi:2-keto-4-pentenoate hydratase/2-oxohepta-3-ene-1,7-dioic acid hydratase in catechol pathway
MKLATFAYGGRTQVGLVDEAAGRLHPISAVADMLDLIERWGTPKGGLALQGGGIPLSEVELKAPIPRPRRNVICVGKNYREHAKEFSHSGFEAGAVKGAEIDEYPAVFTKLPSSVTGPGATVSLHGHVTSSVDYEAELALVVGTGGRDIAKADAYRHIFGYTIVNDVTARDRQRNHKQWFLGKALDGFCPMGPWIATADEVDPENLDVKCWVNGELRQDANTRDLIFDIPTLVATISAGLTLEPGDVIATGTPAGVGIGFNPPKFLKSGDTVRIAISGLGELENRFA